jgi:hypothetical protein
MGVESYLLRDNIVLYEAGSPAEFADAVPIPDHAVGIVATTEDRAFYAHETHDKNPTAEEVQASYRMLAEEMYKQLSSKGIYTKDVLLTPSRPQVPIPEDIIEDFGKEKKPFKAVSLLWLWLASPEHE